MRKVPNKFKFTKVHVNVFKLKNSRIRYNSLGVLFGLFGISSVGSIFLNFNQLETVRRVIIRYLKRFAKLWFRLLVIWPHTKKSKKSRMGKGRGKLAFWLCYICSGSVFLEIAVNPFLKTKDFMPILKSLKHKLPFRVLILSRNIIKY